MKKLQALLVSLAVLGLLTGCGVTEDRTEKIRDIEFTVVPQQEIPKEFLEEIELKKGDVFKLTFADTDSLYICVGYGQQPTGGYSVAVEELYLTPNAIYIDTTLIAPGAEDNAAYVISFPFVCIKTEYIDKTVVFN